MFVFLLRLCKYLICPFTATITLLLQVVASVESTNIVGPERVDQARCDDGPVVASLVAVAELCAIPA